MNEGRSLDVRHSLLLTLGASAYLVLMKAQQERLGSHTPHFIAWREPKGRLTYPIGAENDVSIFGSVRDLCAARSMSISLCSVIPRIEDGGMKSGHERSLRRPLYYSHRYDLHSDVIPSLALRTSATLVLVPHTTLFFSPKVKVKKCEWGSNELCSSGQIDL